MLTKMIEELKRAMDKQENNAVVREHVRAVRLLCDVLLEEKQVDNQAEWKTMVGEGAASKTDKGAKEKATIPTENQDEANGDSIFDF